ASGIQRSLALDAQIPARLCSAGCTFARRMNYQPGHALATLVTPVFRPERAMANMGLSGGAASLAQRRPRAWRRFPADLLRPAAHFRDGFPRPTPCQGYGFGRVS